MRFISLTCGEGVAREAASAGQQSASGAAPSLAPGHAVPGLRAEHSPALMRRPHGPTPRTQTHLVGFLLDQRAGARKGRRVLCCACRVALWLWRLGGRGWAGRRAGASGWLCSSGWPTVWRSIPGLCTCHDGARVAHATSSAVSSTSHAGVMGELMCARCSCMWLRCSSTQALPLSINNEREHLRGPP